MISIMCSNTSTAISGVRKVILTVGLIFALILTIEMALQVRSQVRFGQSIFNVWFGSSLYLRDTESGLLLLRPNQVTVGSKAIIRSNSLGLRSPEIEIERSPGSWRLAVIGASSVMGAYAKDNDKTFTAEVERRLRDKFPSKKIEVVNAGIAGYTLEDQGQMLETRVAALQPDVVIIYSGFNDFAGYCQKIDVNKLRFQRQGLPTVTLPKWLISVDLIKKNTGFLRARSSQKAITLDPEAIDVKPYSSKLEHLISRANELNLALVMTTNTRAYRPDQAFSEQMRLSETARYYNHCFDVYGLNKLYDLHNGAIKRAAATHKIPLIDVDDLIPGGMDNFADSTHFSEKGEVLVAETITDFLVDSGLLPE